MTEGNNARNAERIYRAVTILLIIYSLIELIDCITVVLMHCGVVRNHYPEMAFSEINYLFNSNPVSLLPLFLFFTINRIIAMIGIFKRRLWGFWMTIFICVSTIIVAPFLLPLTGSEMIIDGVLIFLLLLARFGTRKLGDVAAADEVQGEPEKSHQ